MQACAMNPEFKIIVQSIYDSLEMSVYIIELKSYTLDPDETVNGYLSFSKWVSMCNMEDFPWVKERIAGRPDKPWPYQGQAKKTMELENTQRRMTGAAVTNLI